MNNNIFFAATVSPLQYTLQFESVSNDLSSFGTADYNYYARPIDDNKIINLRITGVDTWPGTASTLAQWRSRSGQDAHSHTSPKAITNVNDLLFEYNPTKADKIITLSGNYIDVKGTTYSGSVTLKPYTSIVLIKN
jgi:hypothetical protein